MSTPFPRASSRFQASDMGVYEINEAKIKRFPPNKSLATERLPGISHLYPPADHTLDMLNIASSSPSADDDLPTLAEHGPCLVGRTVSIDYAYFCTRVTLHRGPTATAQLACVNLPDTGFPLVPVYRCLGSNESPGAGSTHCSCATQPRSWGGYGKCERLCTNKCVHISVHFVHNTSLLRPSQCGHVFCLLIPCTMPFYSPATARCALLSTLTLCCLHAFLDIKYWVIS